MSIYCAICSSEQPSLRSLSKHFCQSHRISPKKYYDTFIKKQGGGSCFICESLTKFRSLGEGYSKTCSTKCAAVMHQQNLKKNPEKYQTFKQNTSNAVKKIWEERSPGEKNQILNTVHSKNRKNALILSDQERLERYSRYYTMSDDDIDRLNTIGANHLMKLTTREKFMQGKFKPSFPEKYAGDANNIIYRSSWELRFMSHLDKNTGVIKWASEEFCIPYLDPTTNRNRRYFPDFIVTVRDKEGKLRTTVFEIKPKAQTVPPNIAKNKNKRRLIKEVAAWGTNQAKWKAAEAFCKDKNWDFKILTEHELFGK